MMRFHAEFFGGMFIGAVLVIALVTLWSLTP